MRFELYNDKEGEWRWSLLHNNGNIIADSSQGYNDRRDCLHGIDLVRECGHSTPIVERPKLMSK